MRKIICLVLLLGFSITAAAAPPLKLRKFYLTPATVQGSVQGNQALTACADGFHMASLFEIFDVSDLRYDTTLGATADDSGFGPRTGNLGWIRTGGASLNNDGLAGIDNCLMWTSTNGNGTVAQLAKLWDAPGSIISPWEASSVLCNSLNQVWCVEN